MLYSIYSARVIVVLQEDELRWVEENIPADLAEGDIPGIDSEEVISERKKNFITDN